MEDQQLLRRFVEQNSQDAFAALTTRYLGLVYSVCRRELNDTETAEDVTQAVFLILARKAPTLRRSVILSGWLFQTARFAAKNARLQAQRRAAYEQKAAEAMEQQPGSEDAAWTEIEPLLNQSLAALKEGDRECVLLRYFQEMSFAETGAALGLSEEAARKRVTRALEKMRRIMGKEGIILSGATLAALLPAHALKAAPAHMAESIVQLLAGSVPGHASLLAEGVLQAMKIAKLKLAAGILAGAIAGSAIYAVSGAVIDTKAAKSAHQISGKRMLDSAFNTEPAHFPPPGGQDAVRNVMLTGKVCYENGKPAEKVVVAAQIQNQAMDALFDAAQKQQKTPPGGFVRATKQQQEESWNNVVSQADGTYQLPVGAKLPYNIMVVDESGKWVAAAIEGISGAQNGTVKVPDLVLTRGCLVTGRVTTLAGIPVPHLPVQSYGPHRPDSSAATVGTTTDLGGYYRLRVAPGKSRIYVGDGPEADKVIQIKPGQSATANFRVTMRNAL